MSKIRVAVLFGGRSTEHEISIISAKNIVAAMPKDKYEPILIGINKEGKWLYQEESLDLLDTSNAKSVQLSAHSDEILFSQNADDHSMISTTSKVNLGSIDVIFPVLHGTYGEDGAIQGFAKLANLPCVGPGILGSAIGMDKEVMKRLLRDAGIKNADFITLRRKDKDRYTYEDVKSILGSELFIKPVNLGSSVGVSFVRKEQEFQKAIDHAFLFDNKVLIEKRVIGREIECSVLGNAEPIASIPGEVIPKDGFYSFESKYIDEHGAALEVPAKLSPEQIALVQDISLRTYECLECQGMARVDMFLTGDDQIYINEINTIPGFTNISMYPTLWKLSGISNSELIDRLIQLAIEAHQEQSQLQLKM
jgi:D-alanine-D-alanine ligase